MDSTALKIVPNLRFEHALHEAGLSPLTSGELTWLQVNVGRVCNQACHHCHVDAGPKRTEAMSAATVDRLIALMAATPQIAQLDITGGAPELNPNFRRLVQAGRALGARVIDRCNLTVLLEPGQEDLVAFLADQRVEVVASMPCYLEENVDRQRGRGVYERSIEGLRRLNAAGYGEPGSGLTLDLVYNPGGPFLPPPQEALEADYKARLAAVDVRFDRLLTITNMPIARFRHDLQRSRRLEAYEELLERSFNPATVPGLMCRSLVSVDWQGRLYDCDFNQMLDLEVDRRVGRTLWDVEALGELSGRRIVTGDHCFGCTAGCGSSCGGALD